MWNVMVVCHIHLTHLPGCVRLRRSLATGKWQPGLRLLGCCLLNGRLLLNPGSGELVLPAQILVQVEEELAVSDCHPRDVFLVHTAGRAVVVVKPVVPIGNYFHLTLYVY